MIPRNIDHFCSLSGELADINIGYVPRSAGSASAGVFAYVAL